MLRNLLARLEDQIDRLFQGGLRIRTGGVRNRQWFAAQNVRLGHVTQCSCEILARFVERHLGGSVSPFFAYLSDANELSDAELTELEGIVGKMKSERRKERRSK